MQLPFKAGMSDHVNLSCVREEKLAVSLQRLRSMHFVIEIWITTKIETGKLSWSKFLTLDMRLESDILAMFRNFFIEEEKKVVMSIFKKRGDNTRNRVNFSGEDKYLRRFDLGSPSVTWCRASVCSYVPSLTQVKQQSTLVDMKQSSQSRKSK
ncbi:unnamed protein product [Microthlaspi erraticum]|uniref:F-box associated beta-propeller type 1 domain-containing protein n=1 Tax=Microthlaspi erraticum TaxID=1685480 RepID=A0A6D2HQJ5_9BRAS|nr:unnamed protein product [Microthlaspi erraticum]